jgi:hypothetical protein
MTEALQMMDDCNYERLSDKRERALRKDIYKFMSKYKNILEWVIEHAKQGLRTDRYTQELKEINTNGGGSFYHFIRRLVSLKFKLKTFRKIMFTFKATNISTYNQYLLTNLKKTPYAFINIEYQLISFEKAEMLNEIYNLNATIDIRTNAWVYDLFLKGGRLYYNHSDRKIKAGMRESPAFYLPKRKVQEQYCYYFMKNKFINKLQMTKEILITLKKAVITYKNNKKYYTTDEFMNLEKKLGEGILDLYHEASETAVKEESFSERMIADHIHDYETNRGFQFTEDQKKAIKNGIQKNFSIITGYPGAGKTTVCDCVIAFKQKNSKRKNICLMSPTGLAVKNLRDNCKSYKNNKYLLGTNHRMIYNMFSKIKAHGEEMQFQEFMYFGESDEETDNENNDMPLSVDHIILDEASMVDIFIFKTIIKWCNLFKCQLLLVGDVNQLPPINYGAPFEQIINSSIFDENTTELKEIKRNNGILSTNIIKLNEKILKIEDFDNKEMIFMEEKDFSVENLSNIFTKIKQENKGKRIHFMASQKLKGGGVAELNKILQNIYNPEGQILIPGRYDEYREGDKIIRTENDYSEDKMRVNGDRATLVMDNKCGYNMVCVQYDDDQERQTMSTKDFWDSFTHFYASTVHKMQGSETDIIVLVMPFAHNFMWTLTADSKKLLYTAISRCKEKCIVIGSKNLFRKAQQPKADDAISLFMKEFVTWQLED